MFSGIETKGDAWRRAIKVSAMIAVLCAVFAALAASTIWGMSVALPAAVVGLVLPSATLPWMTFQAVESRRKLDETLSALEGMTKMDSTTRLLNRAGFLENGWALFNAAGASDAPLSAVLLDVDHLDQINQNHGHDCGDAVLAHVAELLGLNIQQGVDLAARYGGAEFALLLPQADQAWASAFAERLRGTLANRAVAFNGELIQVSASFGVASRQPSDTGPEDMIKRASRAMREAKSGGRNKVHALRDEVSALAA